MKKLRSILSMILVVAAMLTYFVTALAASGFSDVSEGAYYAEAVTYASENGLISGTAPEQFSPDMTLSRGMLATMLWRNEGQPQVAPSTFSDIKSDSYYANAIGWAAENGIVFGYGENRFGPDDPVERQQFVTMLYRYADYKGDSIDTANNISFTDSSEIADYAKSAVAWAQENDIVSGKSENRFDPAGQSTRAEAVTMLYRYLTKTAPETPDISEQSGKSLVVYFSWSGTTEEMASYIAEQTGADLLEIEPSNPYPDDYTETGNVAREERDTNARPAIANLPDSIEEYDSIFIGYPIWWHTAPMIIGTFLESYDLSGVDIYPFTQSASMDTEQFDNSMEFVRNSAANAAVHEGLFTRASNTESISRYLSDNGFME